MGRLIGYARVSTGEQDLQPQMDALKTAGCPDADIYTDKASGVRGNRPGLDACVEALEAGDTLVVWRLDRLGRSMPHLVGLGPVEIHRDWMTAALAWIMAAKLLSVLQARMAMRLYSLSLPK